MALAGRLHPGDVSLPAASAALGAVARARSWQAGDLEPGVGATDSGGLCVVSPDGSLFNRKKGVPSKKTGLTAQLKLASALRHMGQVALALASLMRQRGTRGVGSRPACFSQSHLGTLAVCSHTLGLFSFRVQTGFMTHPTQSSSFSKRSANHKGLPFWEGILLGQPR